MSSFFIKYNNLAVHVEQSNKLSIGRNLVYKVIKMKKTEDFESIRSKSPYANCIKIDLKEQLISKTLSRTLPKDILSYVIDIPEVKASIRENKINEILSLYS